jgi:hypothetical protein
MLEHPAIFCYFVEQCVVPVLLMRAIDGFWKVAGGAAISEVGAKPIWRSELRGFRRAVSQRTARSRDLYILLTVVGIIIFSWNSYQNIFPKRVGHDFWDSWNHQGGYWVSRIYKFYFWLFWIPAITHLQVCLISSFASVLRRSSKAGTFKLRPYHFDGCGGTEVLIASVLTPMMIAVLVSALGSAAAFYIHRKLDVTTIGGVVMTCTLFLAAYLWPAIVLRRAIVTDKKKQLTEISQRQTILHSEILIERESPEGLKTRVEAIQGLSTLSKDLRRLPNWPHLRKVAGVAGLAGSSPAAAWLVHQATEYISGFLRAVSI